MKISRLIFGLLATSSFALAEDLALPMADPSGTSFGGPQELLTPTVIIKPPIPGASSVPADRPDARELAILEMERRIIENQFRYDIAQAHRSGTATELKKVIIMNGPVDASISRAAKPPTAVGNKVTLIGLAPSVEVSKNLEQFFGVPMTPARERQLLEAVKSQLASTPDKAGMDVSIAGWWPAEGVMAVSVMPKG